VLGAGHSNVSKHTRDDLHRVFAARLPTFSFTIVPIHPKWHAGVNRTTIPGVIVGMKNTRRALGAVVLLIAFVPACGAVPSDAAIRAILADRAGDVRGVGIVVGVVGPQGRRIIAHGHVNGDTLFEIGSVTKVFTAMLLEDMVQRGEIAVTDPVAKYLPAGTRIPERNGEPITLVDLATHTSGLPFMTDQPIYAFLASYSLPRDPGSQWDYSNIGYWLLGQALAGRAGCDFETALRRRLLKPMRLHSTAITLSTHLERRLAGGHDAALQPAPRVMSLPLYATMAAAGGLVSSANDMCTFLSATMHDSRTAAMLATRRPIGPGREQALGWVVSVTNDVILVMHDGGTPGYASAVAWDPRVQTGVVVLENRVDDVSDIALHLLRPEMPLKKPATMKHEEILLDAAILDRYVGRYDAEGEGVFTIVREGNALTVESPPDWGLPKMRIRAENEHDFFASEVPLRVTFKVTEGRTTGMIVYPPRGQKGVAAIRLPAE